MRACTLASCRGYETEFLAENNRRVVIRTQRQFKATFMCLARPESQVFLINKSEQLKLNETEVGQGLNQSDLSLDQNESRKFLGRVSLPYHLFNKNAVVYDDSNTPLYNIQANGMQCQFCFFVTPSGPCREAVFTISDYRQAKEIPLGHIYKRWSTCPKICCSTAPWYIIDFPEESDWKQRILILVAIQLIDQHYFSGFCT